MPKLRVAVIGAGKIGSLRAETAKSYPGSELRRVVDLDESHAVQLAERMKCEFSTDWETSVSSPATDIVVISATNNTLAKIGEKALAAGKHVLIEKPGATSVEEMKNMAFLAKESHVRAKIGFNHRFHPGIIALKELQDRNQLGNIAFIRARHGHGGRLGYEKEWRANPSVSGGGEIVDQGVHSLDLMTWFMGELNNLVAWIKTCFWNMPVEDTAIALISSSKGANALLNVSWTQWKPIFSFEVYGTNGFGEVEGLGGAYGQETFSYGDLTGAKTSRVSYSKPDDSWMLEWDHFLRAIKENREPMSSVQESTRVLRAVEAIYCSARNGSRLETLKEEQSREII